ncbi:probable serine/threonine-protein kinase PBL15 [Impatiens glandulifera]|uniref:probable serine/threonine-protein kinase PBL15 n=1 Tax=Impatiens glandulifera TaxID=253017 RepID=UPI001FB09EA8|nr:probable serine/threonine-protein kinase PBL15 [Impatiens glandulifera]
MSIESNPLISRKVVLAYDASKDLNGRELKLTVDNIRLRSGILHSGDTLMILGVLQRVPHPLAYQVRVTGSSMRAVEEEVSRRLDAYVNMLRRSASECENQGVDIEVKITAGIPIKNVVLQEVTNCNATWVILDRFLRRDLRFYFKQIPSKIAVVQDNLQIEVLRQHGNTDTDNVEHKLVFSMCKRVAMVATQDNENSEQSVATCKSGPPVSISLESFEMLKSLNSAFMYKPREFSLLSSDDLGFGSREEKSGKYTRAERDTNHSSSSTIYEPLRHPNKQKSSGAPVLCAGCGVRTELYIKESMRFSFSEIQLATNDFSKEKLLGEGGYGFVYKGELRDGQLIAAKVRKEASAQGFSEFHSEVYVLSFARHKNIVMLLGYCCKENVNILVYEYICNKSLEWHLFDKEASVLQWHQRYAIALGTAKGLRFLHEECRGNPIIHRDMRPSNILLTHEFVPMLGDFGLAKWKTNDDPIHTRILGSHGYLAPEYAENGVVSVRTDVFSFGIILIQLISGKTAVNSTSEEQNQSLRQWAEPLLQGLALHQLIDPHIGESYDPYELYHMAKAAYLCIKCRPEERPSMGEVVRLLEGENEHLQMLAEPFIQHYI